MESPFASRYGSVTWRVAVPLALAFVIAIPCAFVLVPRWVVDEGKLGSGAEEVKAENDVRTAALQVLAGLVVATGLGLTARQIQVNREGQVTERFSRSVEQLAHKSKEVRIGGIYALEHIAKDSKPDRLTVIEVLTAYVRQHAVRALPASEIGERQEPRALEADVAAVISVIRRWDWPLVEPLDLESTRLPNANLARADLSRAKLNGADLSGANLSGSENVEPLDADLYSARARPTPDVSSLSRGANLAGAHLMGADLTKAHLAKASLHHADLYGADLTGADLTGADLYMANLTGARLDYAILSDAHLSAARHTAATRWPEGFDPEAAGAVLVTD